jgi:uncharacterized protein
MLVHQDWLLTAERAAVYLPEATAVIADVHLGYDRARRRGGEAVPLTDLDAALGGLRRLVARTDVRRLVVAGDLFEDGRLCGGAAELLRWFVDLRVELTAVVLGNHDRRLQGADAALPVVGEASLGPWRVVHGDGRLPRGPVVSGHVHPYLRWGPKVAAPCFLVGANRLILPAFSEDAAGVNVLGDPRWRRFRCCAVAGEDVLDFGELGALPKSRRAGR